jgi:hypothetical protein
MSSRKNTKQPQGSLLLPFLFLRRPPWGEVSPWRVHSIGQTKQFSGEKKKKTFASVVLSLAGAHSLSTRAVIAPTAIQIEIISSKNFTLFFLKLTFPSCLFASRGVPITTGGCLLLLLCHPFLLLTRKLKSVENNRQSLCDNYIRHKRNEFK